MDSKRAAEVLRGEKATVYEQVEAQMLGAQALEAWAWVERTGGSSEYRVLCAGSAGTGPTPLAAVLDAMEREGKG